MTTTTNTRLATQVRRTANHLYVMSVDNPRLWRRAVAAYEASKVL